ncbi:MAG: hypothetical protein ACLRQF_03925 [Thomasclavelia ramosa]
MTHPGFIANKHNLAIRYPNGESFIELCKRVYEFLDEIKEQATKVMLSVSWCCLSGN